MIRTYPRDHATLAADGTTDPIYLLQRRSIVWAEGADLGAYAGTVDAVVDPEGYEITDEQALEAGAAVETWVTEAVFLTRAEATAYGNGRIHRWGTGWRVWCVPAQGALVAVLAAATVGGRYR